MGKPMKCLVHGCENHSDQGRFIGELCSPCHEMITTGKVSPYGHTFIQELNKKLSHEQALNVKIRSLVDNLYTFVRE